MANPKRPSDYLIERFGLIIGFTFLLTACSRQHDFPQWMAGRWKSSFDGMAIRETWQPSGDQFTGSTIWLWDGKSRKEILTLFYNQEDQLIYRVKMEKKTIDFVCEDPAEDTLVFVNNKNDFPKRLVYVQPKGRKMTVWIDNEPNDPNRMTFPFEKIP